MSKEDAKVAKVTKVEKKKRKLSINPVIRLVSLLALGILAYAGVLSLIQADVLIANAIAVVIVALLVKEAF
jgi:hypothetical protein